MINKEINLLDVVDENSSSIKDWADPLILKYQFLNKVDVWIEKQFTHYHKKYSPKIRFHKPAILFLTHDYDYNLDRRMTQQVEVWQQRGYHVSISCLAVSKPSGIQAINVANRETKLYKYSWFDFTLSKKSIPIYAEIMSLVRSSQAEELNFLGELSENPFPITNALVKKTMPIWHDIVIACDLPALPAAVMLGKAYSCPILYDMHEIYPEQIGHSKARQFFLYLLEKCLLPKVDIAYAVSKQAARFIMSAYLPVKEVRYISNAPAVFNEKFEIKNRLRKKIQVDESAIVLLFHGGITDFRNLETLISAYALTDTANNSALVLMGYGEIKKYKDLISSTGRKDIFLLDPVPQKELAEWVIDSDFVLIPYPACDHNTRNCTPNKLFDSILLSRPIIANRDLTTLSEIIHQYNIGYTIRTDTDDNMTDDLNYILNVWSTKKKIISDADSSMLPKFSQAQLDLGWPSQIVKINEWIIELEASFLLNRNYGKESYFTRQLTFLSGRFISEKKLKLQLVFISLLKNILYQRFPKIYSMLRVIYRKVS